MTVKISELPAIPSIALNDIIPIDDTSAGVTRGGTGQQVIDLVMGNTLDSAFRVAGSSDATKKVALEVDGRNSLPALGPRLQNRPLRSHHRGIGPGRQQGYASQDLADRGAAHLRQRKAFR